MKRPAIHLGLIVAGTSTVAFAQNHQEPTTESVAEFNSSVVELAAPPDRHAAVGELVRQRFPSGAVQIERWVLESDSGDFVNHGPFRKYDLEGSTVVQGQFHNGQRIGDWSQVLSSDQVRQLSGFSGLGFEPPYTSKATFRDGQLDGRWTCVDGVGLPVFEWRFEQGKRHGQSIWYNSQGVTVQKLNYVRNQVEGDALVFEQPDERPREVVFDQGRERERIDQWYPLERGAQRRLLSQTWYLTPAKHNLNSHDWSSGIIEFEPADPSLRVRDGKSITFYRNGQRESEGQYCDDVRIGTFVWWYATGQQSTLGEYRNDKEQGEFSWWHENGMKQAHGRYSDGQKIGNWAFWSPTGKLLQRVDLSRTMVAGQSVEQK